MRPEMIANAEAQHHPMLRVWQEAGPVKQNPQLAVIFANTGEQPLATA